MQLDDLKQRYHDQRANYPEPFRLRIHRAISWLKRADVLLADGPDELARALKINTPHTKTRLSETAVQALAKTGSDWDFAFVSLWIAFNAIYARDLNLKDGQDRVYFRDFLGTVCRLDKEQCIYQLVWETFSSDIRALLNNHYVFQPFWDFHNGLIPKAAFEEQFQHTKQKANDELAKQNTESLLALVFNCLYTLRNQIIHGGSTWNSSANRQQIQSACTFLNKILPIFIAIMMENPSHEAWGKPFYPFVKEN